MRLYEGSLSDCAAKTVYAIAIAIYSAKEFFFTPYIMSTFDRRRVQAPESSSAPAYQPEGDAGPSRPTPTPPGEICASDWAAIKHFLN